MGKRERNERRKRRQARREQAARGVVRQMITEYLSVNKDATLSSATPAIKDRIRGEFGSSPWLELLLKLVDVLLPLLLELFSSDDDDDDEED